MPQISKYVRPKIGEEVTAIGGHYIWIKGDRLFYDGREVLYFIGAALIDTGCCGPSGCGFASVAGFVVDWKYRKTDAEESISRVEGIPNASVRNEIARLIRKREGVQQIHFYP